MSRQSIESHDISVDDIFKQFYAVPNYQREYVWETTQVEQFLSDINDELGDDPENAPEYFIGSIVVCLNADGVLELIDGQQRMTTLFLALCAIRDGLNAIGEDSPGALASQIAATSTDALGRDRFRYRLDLQYEDSGDILERIAKADTSLTQGRQTRSITNIENAYQVIRRFLESDLLNAPDSLRIYYGYLINKVKLIRIQTPDVAKALKVFETINDRGVGLDSMDLLKNLLFMKASREQFESLKNHWKELQDTIFDIGERPLRFLRYFILSQYDVDILREDQIYAWFSQNETACGYAEDPIAFARRLHLAAQSYRYFLAGEDRNGRPVTSLANLQLLGGKSARQHLILLLAAKELPEPLFDRLSAEVENILFVYVITRESTRAFERNFAVWASEVRDVSTTEELEAFVGSRFVPAKAELATRFDDAFENLYDDSVQRYRLRYILAKLTQHVELLAYGITPGTSNLSRYTGFEIEHILPQQPSAQALDEFGATDDPRVSQRLGNLVLVEQPINASLGNRAYSEKRKVFPQSQLLLTKALSEKPKVGANTKIDQAVQDIDPFQEWDQEALLERHAWLGKLARMVWGVDATP